MTEPEATAKGSVAFMFTFGIVATFAGIVVIALGDKEGAPPEAIGYLMLAVGSALQAISVIAWGVALGLRLREEQRA